MTTPAPHPTSTSSPADLPVLKSNMHVVHCKRCLTGLPPTHMDVDPSKLAVAFYCIGTLDLLGQVPSRTTEKEREEWRKWIWNQQTTGQYGTGFRPSTYMTFEPPVDSEVAHYHEHDTPNIIMTYTALLSLSILRDDFKQLDRVGVLKFLKSCQREDGSFSTVPGGGDSDLRTIYCAFSISTMLNDWSAIRVPSTIDFIGKCRTFDGGYGREPFTEAQGGTTYTAIASLHLAPPDLTGKAKPLTDSERQTTIHWLVQNQLPSGGFVGRPGKAADACYCFWCGAALLILGAQDLVDATALISFVNTCQFKYGGISKSPEDHADPFHTYLALAAVAMYASRAASVHPSWVLDPLDPLLNAREETALWARKHIPTTTSDTSE